MGFNNFRIIVIVRIGILSLSIFLLFYFIRASAAFIPLSLLALIVIQILSLIRFIDKTNRDLTSFLESIRFSEFTRSFQVQGAGSSFDALNKAFDNVIMDFQKVRAEKEEHFHYLQNIVQNIDVSVIAYQRDGTVEMVNKAAYKLFQVNSLKNIEKLRIFSEELVEMLLTIKPGENKLLKVQEEDDFLQLAINATEFKLKDKLIVLSTIKNIQNVLEEQETETWQKLIRVLTHEIMNSIAPISSLSATLEHMLDPTTPGTGPDRESLDEIRQAIQTINKRSNGLIHFVNTYRNLTTVPKPHISLSRIDNIFNNLETILANDLKKAHINLTKQIDPQDLEISLDEQLIDQVLINLIKNSIYALEGKKDKRINLKGFFNKRGRPCLQVTDNGAGILKEVLDKIFIPFFTTKQQGSGIGLSFSRQILRLHGGTITAQSVPDEGSTFTLTF